LSSATARAVAEAHYVCHHHRAPRCLRGTARVVSAILAQWRAVNMRWLCFWLSPSRRHGHQHLWIRVGGPHCPRAPVGRECPHAYVPVPRVRIAGPAAAPQGPNDRGRCGRPHRISTDCPSAASRAAAVPVRERPPVVPLFLHGLAMRLSACLTRWSADVNARRREARQVPFPPAARDRGTLQLLFRPVSSAAASETNLWSLFLCTECPGRKRSACE